MRSVRPDMRVFLAGVLAVAVILSAHAQTTTQSVGSSLSGPASGSLTGSFPNPGLAAGSVTSSQLGSGAVTSTAIGSGAAASNVGTIGGVLGGTLPNPTMASGAATANIGTLGGVLGGTLPSPTMAAGAAATNIGTVGGDLTGTLPNPTAVGMTRRLCKITSANMNVTTDQACAIPAAITAWAPTAIWVTNCNATLAGGLAAGGFYTAASKGGTAIVAAVQVYTGLTTATIILPLTIATGLTTRFTVASAFFSLTVANGSAVTCDVYLLGQDLT